MTNCSNRSLKWCVNLRNSNRVTEEGIFKVCNGSMIPFVNRDAKSFGPEGELRSGESFELKILFCPGLYLSIFKTAMKQSILIVMFKRQTGFVFV